MKSLKILGAALPIAGTAAAGSFPVANAIQNNPENFKNEPFKKVYKEGSWRPRFFSRIEFNFDKEEVVDEYEKCGLGNSYQTFLYWLNEIEEKSIKKMLNEKKDYGYIYMIIEFEKKGDWFNRNKRNSWYLFSYGNKDVRYSDDEWINKLKNFLNLDRKSATEEVFSVLEAEERFLLKNKTINDVLLKKKLLFEPLNVETEKFGKCEKIIFKNTHIT